MSKSKIFIALDGEFTGPNPFKHYMIALGAYALNDLLDYESDFEVSMEPPLNAQGGEHGFDDDCIDNFWVHHKDLLKEFRKNAMAPEKAMKLFIEWVEEIQETHKESEIIFLVDCTADVFWIDFYLMKYTDHNPLNTFFGEYTGQPFVTDDQYRGALKILDAWGLDKKIDKKLEAFPPIRKGNHYPSDDAREICTRFSRLYAVTYDWS